MEVISDDNTRIWHVNFETPGSKNDGTIMNHSEFIRDVRNKKWSPCLPDFVIKDYNIRKFYYLADGICPKMLIFAWPHPNPMNRKEKMYGSYHSSPRKAVERVFGVLYRQFRIVYNKSRLQDDKEMEMVVEMCCVLHNMIEGKRGYEGTMKSWKELEEANNFDLNLKELLNPECREEQAR